MVDPRSVVFDRQYELDWRSLAFPVTAALEQPVYRPRSYTWSISDWFDQGSEGACVAFAFVHDLVAKPQVVVGLSDTHARGWYHHFQHEDPWPGCALGPSCPIQPSTERDRYEGTSVLAGAKVVTDKGFYSSYHWALSIEELVIGLGYFGPCVLGLDWYEGMFWPDDKGFLHPTGRIAGGHAILAHAVKIVYKPTLAFWRQRTWADVDLARSYVVLHNSWGKSWGDLGRAKLSLADLERLLHQQGDACFPKRTTKTAIG